MPSEIRQNRQVGDHFNFYEREGRFYEHVGQSIAVRTPNCLFNHLDVAGNQFALILEDFGGRTMVSQIAGMPMERATEAVRAIASVHAQWWDTPAVHALDWMPRLTDPPNSTAGGSYREAWPRFVESFGADLPEGSLGLGERVGADFEAIQLRRPRTRRRHPHHHLTPDVSRAMSERPGCLARGSSLGFVVSCR